MSVDLRYVNPKISPFVDPGGPTKTERFEPAVVSLVSLININCYPRLYCTSGGESDILTLLQ